MGYGRRLEGDKQTISSTGHDPPSCQTPLRHLQSGTLTEIYLEASGAQASAAGCTCLRDGYPPRASTRSSMWLSSRPCKLLQIFFLACL
eukprot:2390791-Prymnesium_polylepis.1